MCEGVVQVSWSPDHFNWVSRWEEHDVMMLSKEISYDHSLLFVIVPQVRPQEKNHGVLSPTAL